MAWRSAGSLSRSLLSTARASSVRSSPALPLLRPSQLPTSPLGLVVFPSPIQGHWENSDAHCHYYLLLQHVISHHIYHLTLELSAGFLREMGKMANTGHQMLQQRIKDATNFQYMNGDFFIGTTLLMIRGLFVQPMTASYISNLMSGDAYSDA